MVTISILTAIAALNALLVYAFLQLWDYLPKWRQKRNADGLFHELCHAHRLDESDRGLLKMLAFENRLDPPALVFVRPDLFNGEQLPMSLHRWTDDVAVLQSRLFVPKSLGW